TQNNALTISGTDQSYTASGFTLGVGKGLQAKMIISPIGASFEDAYLLLSTRSAGMSSGAPFNDSRYVGIEAQWDQGFDRTIFFGVDGSVGTFRGEFITQLSGNHTGELFTLDISRLAMNTFTYSVRD